MNYSESLVNGVIQDAYNDAYAMLQKLDNNDENNSAEIHAYECIMSKLSYVLATIICESTPNEKFTEETELQAHEKARDIIEQGLAEAELLDDNEE